MNPASGVAEGLRAQRRAGPGGRFELKAFDQHGNLFDTLDIDKERN